uniref:Uncharacterized protein n=1 Tax=Ixodes ricinus TaxID=34613 RepID=A0A0K8R579_IXORI
MESDSKIGNLLCNSAEIAELILCGMNSRQLSSCAKVCSLWSSIAKRLKRQRRMFLHTFQVKCLGFFLFIYFFSQIVLAVSHVSAQSIVEVLIVRRAGSKCTLD